MIYFDDSLIQRDTRELCEEALARSTELFHSLGFIIHPRKSVFTPIQIIEFLGFVLDSRSMAVSLTLIKSANLKQSLIDILQTDMVSIQSLDESIGHLDAAVPGVLFGTVFFERLEILNIKAL